MDWWKAGRAWVHASHIPTMKSIRGHYILREALETQAARIFTGKASPDERDEVRRLAAELDRMNSETIGEETADRERLFKVHLVHMRFHMRVAECTGCDELCQAIQKNQILVFNWLYDTALGNDAPPPGWHSELAQVLLSGDAEAADAAMRRHVRYRMDEVLMRMEPNLQFSEARLAVFSRRPRRKKNAESALTADK